MKNVIIILCTVFTYSIIVLAQNQWEWVSPNPPYKEIYSSVTIGNTTYFWCHANTVMRMFLPTEKMEYLSIYTSPDENVGIGDFGNQGIAFADSLNGYIADISYGEFRTTDGGLHWFQTANPGSNIFIVAFGSSLRGWKLGGGGFYRTENAGATWTFLGGPFFQSGSFSKIFPLNENELWILTKAYYSGSEGSVWFSDDGGTTFSKINTGLISDSLNLVSYYDFKMNASGVGFAAGTVYRENSNVTEGFIQKTTNMGLTWSTTTFQNERFKNILSISDNEWLILGNSGYYSDSEIIQRKTTDIGITWQLTLPVQEPLSNYTYFYNSVYSQTTDMVYIFTSLGIYKSNDRGNSYSKMTSDTDVLINEIVFDNKPTDTENQLGFAWLKWNIRPYIISTDGGETWHQKSLPQSMGYIWLVGISENVIYMIVNQNQLYKSTDYGESWELIYVPVSGGKQALKVYDKDFFVMKVANNLVSSTDGGNTWISGPIIWNLWLENTDIISYGNVVGVGSYSDTTGTRGAFYKTTDSGLSWHIIDTEKQLHEIQMLTDKIGIALEDNKVHRTSDSGESWQTVLSQGGFYNYYTALAFSDSLTGYVTAGYYFEKTINGGINWTTEDPRIPLNGVDKIVYNANGDLFAIGGIIMLKLPSSQTSSPEINKTLNNISTFTLQQNYPNPFNPRTIISYQLPVTSNVTLKVYDILGNEIATLVNEEKPAGTYEVEFTGHSDEGQNLPSGIYFYQLKTGNYIETKKMLMIK